MKHKPNINHPLSPSPLVSNNFSLAAHYHSVRSLTETLTDTLLPEDMTAQAMPDASPAKWHLAHTSWFFETFLLTPYLVDYEPLHPAYSLLFNSYYQAIGPQFTRAERGVLTRPSVAEIRQYRQWVDQHMATLLEKMPDDTISTLTTLGIHHEQQHQELLLTDIKTLFARNPLYPAYRPASPASQQDLEPLNWLAFEEGVYSIGHATDGFAFDNEGPRHKQYLRPFKLASRLVTNGEYKEFIESGGYGEPRHWLAEGWNTVQRENWHAPLYWIKQDDAWLEFTLSGLQPLQMAAPICHISFYEASAYAHWAGKRLPSEAEWEVAAHAQHHVGQAHGRNFELHRLHPQPAAANPQLTQLFGEAWQWTASAYLPYPGFVAQDSAIGEYNGKFMCGQMVLRGSACVTPPGHARATYRNFFPPSARWQFASIRLAS